MQLDTLKQRVDILAVAVNSIATNTAIPPAILPMLADISHLAERLIQEHEVTQRAARRAHQLQDELQELYRDFPGLKP